MMSLYERVPRKENNFLPEAKIYCDGASSGNPGASGIGVIIVSQKLQVTNNKSKVASDLKSACGGQPEAYRISEYIGIATNNIAEYSALIRGLEKAISLGLKRAEIFLDSELLVRQIKGIYKVKSNNLKALWERAQNLLKKFDNYRVIHIPRELNREADSLAKKAIKGK